jgi:hypothetical protein
MTPALACQLIHEATIKIRSTAYQLIEQGGIDFSIEDIDTELLSIDVIIAMLNLTNDMKKFMYVDDPGFC